MPDIEKAESSSKKSVTTAKLKTEAGQPRLINSAYFVNQTKRKDLQMPQSLYTYDCMAEDDAVYSSIDLTNLHVVTALYNGQFEGKRGSKKSKVAAEVLNYLIRNMSYGTWLDTCNNAVTDLQYGFSLLNIVLEKRNYGQYKGAMCIKKLAPRDQKTVYAWLFDENYREVLGFVQRPNIKNTNAQLSDFNLQGITLPNITGNLYDQKFPVLRNEQLLHFKYNATNNNPQGDTPLNHCYKAWKEKTMIEQFEIIGVTKGLGGQLILRVPSELIEQANDPDNHPQAAMEYQQLQEDAAKMYSGEGGLIVLTSDTDEKGTRHLFDLEMKEVTGSSGFNTGPIIDQKKKSIYNCFGAGHLILGQDGGGSMALSTNSQSTHGHYINRNILQKVDVINNQLVPRLLEANGIHLNWKDMPEFMPADPDKLDLDVLGKFIQRVGSVMKLTPEVLEYLYKKADFPIEGIEGLDFTDKGASRSGESFGSGGQGTTVAGRDSSSLNSENASKSLIKHLVLEGDTIIDTETGDEFIAKEDQLS